MTTVDVLKTLARGDSVRLTLRADNNCTARIELKEKAFNLDPDQVLLIHQQGWPARHLAARKMTRLDQFGLTTVPLQRYFSDTFRGQDTVLYERSRN